MVHSLVPNPTDTEKRELEEGGMKRQQGRPVDLFLRHPCPPLIASAEHSSKAFEHTTTGTVSMTRESRSDLSQPTYLGGEMSTPFFALAFTFSENAEAPRSLVDKDRVQVRKG